MLTATRPTRIMLLEGTPSQRDSFMNAVALNDAAIDSPVISATLMQQVSDARPDCLFLDGDLPGAASFEALADIRRNRTLDQTRVVFMTADQSEQSRGRAYAGGADELLFKPYTLDEVLATEASMDRFRIRFWGTRGTLPVPGPRTLKYGGNTSCVSLDIGRDRHFILDAGTGLRQYSLELMEHQGGRFNGRFFISHPHWDHLNCIPFFAPFYIPGNQISIMGPPQADRSFRSLIDAQMDGVFFPITINEFGASVTIDDIQEGEFLFDGVRVTTLRLRHPGHCIAFRFDHCGRSMAYVTDNELGKMDADDPYIQKLLSFIAGVDVMIHDTTYFDDEYPNKINWGHSSISQVVRLAHMGGVGRLYLFHHDPEHDDQAIERKLAFAETLVGQLGSTLECAIAVEGQSYSLNMAAVSG